MNDGTCDVLAKVKFVGVPVTGSNNADGTIFAKDYIWSLFTDLPLTIEWKQAQVSNLIWTPTTSPNNQINPSDIQKFYEWKRSQGN